VTHGFTWNISLKPVKISINLLSKESKNGNYS
jgi:hypothetical protein